MLFQFDQLLVGGGVVLAISVVALGVRALFVSRAQRCRAVVIRHIGSRSRSEIVRVHAPDGSVHEARMVSAGRTVRPIGTEVEVLHAASRPTRVIGATWWDTWGPPLIGLALGAALVSAHVLTNL